MQGIVLQASNYKSWWPAKCLMWEVVSEIDWTLVQEIWWIKMEKIKGDRRATSQYGIFLRKHSSPRTSSTVVRVQVEGVDELRTLEGMPGLVIVLNTVCACQWERRRIKDEEIELLQQLLTAPAGLCQNDVSAWVAPAIFRFANLKMAGATPCRNVVLQTWRWLGQPMPKRRSDTNLLVPWEVVVIMSSQQDLSLKLNYIIECETEE